VPGILEEIIGWKRREVAERIRAEPLKRLLARLDSAPPVRNFFAPLAPPGPIRLIAEVKKASPSRGLIRADFDPGQIAVTYQKHGASCLSVLTDEKYFQGSLENLRMVRAQVAIPVLRKDFIIEPYQVIEARVSGADAVLLIAECLTPHQLEELLRLAGELGMYCLVEVYEAENLAWVLDLPVKLVGINNRNLRTFEVDLEHTLHLREQIPSDRVVVSESGIRSRADLLRLEAAGIHAVLVGEWLMSQPDIGRAVDELLGRV